MLPRDPNLLYSVVNTKLRDFYGSLQELCDREDEDPEELLARIKAAGYRYDPEKNRLIS